MRGVASSLRAPARGRHSRAVSSVAGRGRGRGSAGGREGIDGPGSYGSSLPGVVGFDAELNVQENGRHLAPQLDGQHQWHPFDGLPSRKAAGRGAPLSTPKKSAALSLHGDAVLEKFEGEVQSLSFGFRAWPTMRQQHCPSSQGVFNADSPTDKFLSDWEEGVSRKEDGLLSHHAFPNSAQWSQPLPEGYNAAGNITYNPSVNDPHPHHDTTVDSASGGQETSVASASMSGFEESDSTSISGFKNSEEFNAADKDDYASENPHHDTTFDSASGGQETSVASASISGFEESDSTSISGFKK